MTAPCATCRHEVDHLIALDIAITDIRAKTRTHRSLRAVLLDHIHAARKATRRHLKHRRDEHADERRTTISGLADHLTEHAQEAAA